MAFIITVAVFMVVIIIIRPFLENLISARLFKVMLAWTLFLILWEASIYTGIFRSVLLSPPTVVLSKGYYYLEKGYLQMNIISTISRFIAGFMLAVVFAIPLGLFFGVFKRLYEWISPVLDFVRMIPPPAILPFAILVLGIGEGPAVFVIAVGCFFPIFINTIRGVKDTEAIHLEVVQTMGGNRYDLFRYVILPSSFPTIIAGIRIGFGIGWFVLISAEIVAADRGLGYMIQGARKLLDTPTVFVGMATICVIGLTLDMFFRRIERHFILKRGGGEYVYR